MTPRALVILALAGCGSTTTFDTFGGGTVSVEVTPTAERGFALSWEGSGDTEEHLHDASAWCFAHEVVVRDGDHVENGVEICTPELPVDAADLCVSAAIVTLRADQYEDTGGEADLTLSSGEPDFTEHGWASLAPGPYTTGGAPDELSGRIEGDLDVADPCDPSATLPHHVVVAWSFDEKVLEHSESDRGGGLPGVGE